MEKLKIGDRVVETNEYDDWMKLCKQLGTQQYRKRFSNIDSAVPFYTHILSYKGTIKVLIVRWNGKEISGLEAWLVNWEKLNEIFSLEDNKPDYRSHDAHKFIVNQVILGGGSDYKSMREREVYTVEEISFSTVKVMAGDQCLGTQHSKILDILKVVKID